jgi:fucose 4-O-acetylase-like acetyltransferase
VEAVATRPQRVGWVDCCKGICIVLVVYGHIEGGVQAARVITDDSIFAAIRDWVYLFHIPAFFFLSGLFAQKTCDRPLFEFLRNRARVLLYPYLVWTAVVLASQFAMSSMVNTPPSFSRALECLWEPYGVGLWFLYALFLASVLFWCLRHLRLPPVASLAIGTALFLVALRNGLGSWYILNESMRHAIYFIAGGCYPRLVAAPIQFTRRGLLLAAAAFLFTVMTLSQLVHSDPIGILKLARAFLGIAAVVCLAMALARTTTGRFWTLLGASSLEIYLAHPLWGTASRGVLIRLGVHSPLVFVVCGVFFGVAGSYATALLCQRLDFPYLFRWPVRRADQV